MSFGYQRQPRVFMHDTQRLVAYLQAEDDETPVPASEIDAVTFSVKRPEDDDKAAFILLQSALHLEASEPGAYGNAYTVTVVNPGAPGVLSVALVGFDLTITLAHDGNAITSTVEDVVEALQDDVLIWPFITAEVQKNEPIHTNNLKNALMEAHATANFAHGDGPALYRVSGTIDGDGLASYLVPSTFHTQAGEYVGAARFTLTDGQIRSVPIDYEVLDQFEDMGEYPGDGVVDAAWGLLEDCFDSELGGPWLRDMTMGSGFRKGKMRSFLGQALFDINNQIPQTDFTEGSFPYGASDGGDALFTQGLLCAAIRHLMRSYTEQPDVTSSPVAFLDRKRYAMAWKSIYDVEWALYLRWLALYKRRLWNMNATRLIVSSKAGRLYGPNVRTRNIGRGMYF